MRIKSFSTVVIRIIGMMTIIYGLITLLYIAIMYFMFADFGPGARTMMGSMLWLQLLLPILMIVIGLVLIAAGRSLSNAICSGLDE